MSAYRAFRVPRWLRAALAVATLPLALAACDEQPPPHAMTLVQAANSPDADAQQARAALAGSSLREYLQIYFGGESLSGQGAAPQSAPPAGAD